MMTYLLPCVLLLLPMVSTEMTGHEFVEQLNEKRRVFAEKTDIANMRQLTWSKDLAVEVVDNWDNSALRATPNRYLANIESYEDVLNTLNVTVNEEKLNLIELKDNYLLYFLAPLHNEIGCATPPDDTKTQWYCYFSPVSPLDKVFDSFGKPGQRCGEGYEVDDGMCKQVPTTTPVPKTTQKPKVTKPAPTNETVHQAADDIVALHSSTVSYSFINTIVFFSFSFLVLLD